MHAFQIYTATHAEGCVFFNNCAIKADRTAKIADTTAAPFGRILGNLTAAEVHCAFIQIDSAAVHSRAVVLNKTAIHIEDGVFQNAYSRRLIIDQFRPVFDRERRPIIDIDQMSIILYSQVTAVHRHI